MTGSRVKQIEKHIKDDMFMLTYGDGVSDINIHKLLEYHKSHGKIGTITGVSPPSRYGELLIHQDQVLSFREKPASNDNSINGGYFVYNKKIFNYLRDEEDCILEREPLEMIAKDKELQVYQHTGFWQCMDTYRDYKYLNEIWDKGNPPWKVWND